MRLYSSAELERLRLIKHLVDEAGVNLAGVQRLLSIVDAVRRLRALAASDGLPRAHARRLSDELDRLSGLLGL
jgi:DNA-binding transcriptional MerR regulator